MMQYSVGIDVGATKVLAGLVAADGSVLCRVRRATPADNRDQVVATIVEAADELVSLADRESHDLVGIGVGTAGQVNFAEGVVMSGTPNISDWMNVNLRAALSSLRLPVWVDNDVNVHLLAEARLGAAVGRKHVLMLALGTGVGGAAYGDGGLVRGQWGGACEFGHISVNYRGPSCNCGSRGCLELYASGTGIAHMMQQRLPESDSHIDARMVFQRMKDGDPIAASVVDDMLSALSMACVTLIHTFNPQMIVLGGGVVDGNEWLLDALRQRLGTLGMSSLVGAVDIVSAQYGAQAGLVGAALQPFIYAS